jgi:putative ABC transport system permease protein
MNIAGSIQLGLIYAVMALGVFVAFRIMNTPDLTADGSFTLGLCVSAMAAAAGHPLLGLLAALVCGALAGIVTGLLQTKAGVHPILAGILTMTALYSVNVFVMEGSPNKSLIGSTTIFSLITAALPALGKQSLRTLVAIVFSGGSCLLLHYFFRTSLGLQLRATGSNEKMVRASSINAALMRVTAIALSNAFIALSGALLAQYQGYADINAGSGIVIMGLASVIIGETLLPWRGVSAGIFSAALGAVIYRLLIALVLYLNFFPAYMLKFMSAFIVALALSAPRIKSLISRRSVRRV